MAEAVAKKWYTGNFRVERIKTVTKQSRNPLTQQWGKKVTSKESYQLLAEVVSKVPFKDPVSEWVEVMLPLDLELVRK